ncbi:response regulator [Parachitinimonas caeni]|uniref:Response regulator n=1 Tax=Parachitinimonas caeni TaxID=3031301 RepID=A0ABT7DYC0_9NEIS|nr:response regulator [Parachitinimonas caeni]MDK2125057.1 response regulator [Parachitinimonas caeni]
MQRVLIVEDEERLAGLLQDFLRQAGYDTHWLDNGNAVVPWVTANTPDAIMLDLMLPGVDGLSICRELRRHSDIPILITTARVEEIDRLLGLELGADDYICKPYSMREAVARVKAVLRRRSPGPAPADTPLQFEDDKLRATLLGQTLDLTQIEYQLLRLLARHPGRIYSRDMLMNKIYEDNRVVADRTVDSHVKKLRRKMADVDPDHEYIQSVYGAGYKFE